MRTLFLSVVGWLGQGVICPWPAVGDGKVLKLIEALQYPKDSVRLSAMKKLADFGTAAKQAVPALSVHLRDSNKEIANPAARALGQIGAASVPQLIKALDDRSPGVRTRALVTLGTIGREAKEAVVPVRELLKHKDARVRLTAALVLGAMHEEARPAAAYLEKALRDPDPQVRFVAADALHQIGQEGVPHLITVLNDADAAIRFNALRTLAWFPESPNCHQGFVRGY